jgi:hypothetical protein
MYTPPGARHFGAPIGPAMAEAITTIAAFANELRPTSAQPILGQFQGACIAPAGAMRASFEAKSTADGDLFPFGPRRVRSSNRDPAWHSF